VPDGPRFDDARMVPFLEELGDLLQKHGYDAAALLVFSGAAFVVCSAGGPNEPSKSAAISMTDELVRLARARGEAIRPHGAGLH
jgi:hypothetical protein